ncbi:MAG: tRNA epoxyqueuosine(34) reductase QueG [Dehalococcoidia bacterium]
MTYGTITHALKVEALRLGFAAVAIADVEPMDETRTVFETRIARGSYSGLPWFTVERAVRSTDPARSLDGVRSVISLAAPYRAVLDADEATLGDEPRGRIARYAWGRDYHRALERPVKQLAGWLAERSAGTRSRMMIDHGPLAERAIAARGGLGWFGKSTNLLTPAAGSWVLLAELLTTAELEPDAPLRKSCGSCARCIVACPTGAIVGPNDLDNNLCISYQTIENRGAIPRPLRPLLGDWIFGCDVCQDACPVPSRAEAMVDFRPATVDVAAPPLIPLLSLTEEQFRHRFAGRPLMRAKRNGLLRNVCIALGNLGDDRAVPALTDALNDTSPLVRGHAAWALGRLGMRAPLDIARHREQDANVRAEIDATLAGEGDGTVVPSQQPMGEWLTGRRWTDLSPDPSSDPSPRRGGEF